MDDKNTKIKLKDHFIWIDAKSKFMTLDVQTKIKTTPKVIAPGVLALNIERIDIGRLPLSKQKLCVLLINMVICLKKSHWMKKISVSSIL